MTEDKIKILLQQGENSKNEFKKRINKELANEICAFSNSSGGFLIIGIDDNNEVCGVENDNSIRSKLENSISAINPRPDFEIIETKFNDKDLIIIDCKEGKNKPYIISGSIFVRYGANSQKLISADEIRSFFQEGNQIHWDLTECKDFKYPNDFNETVFSNFILQANITEAISQNQIIKNLDLLSDTEKFKAGAVLFFANKPEKFYSNIGIRCVLFKGTNKRYILDDKLFTGDLLSQYENAIDYLKFKLETRYEIESQGSMPRKEILEIPEIVLKESIINAICHRDYFATGAIIHIEIFDNRIDISNPGGLVPQIKKDEFGTKSYSRNTLIFSLFQRMRLVEKVGTGIPRIKASMKSANLFDPEFKTEGFFTITLYRPISVVKWLNNLEIELSKNQKNIILAMDNNKNIIYEEISEKIGIGKTATENNIRKLRELGLIERIGDKKTGYWQINTKHR
jgi:ATP-dependent DNA helicase RecG